MYDRARQNVWYDTFQITSYSKFALSLEYSYLILFKSWISTCFYRLKNAVSIVCAFFLSSFETKRIERTNEQQHTRALAISNHDARQTRSHVKKVPLPLLLLLLLILE